MADAPNLSSPDLRRALRALPPKRRRGLMRAVREGRAVDDPRDAALAVAVTRRIQATRWPRWVLPETRPRGRRALLWGAHATWLVLVLVAAVIVPVWRINGIGRWILVGVLAYAIVSSPWMLALVLRTRWNAHEAERQNRELLATTGEGGHEAQASLSP